ncbi:MAG TPA: hypothetical protein VEU94_16385 [Terriglobales bacterium]|nr:hypothetical protein [Terriglobales bacterium]
MPPSLELPKPPSDLRAIRKGDHVYLFWSVPTQTIDRQTIRRQGPTRICRSLEALMSACGTVAGNVPPEAQAELQNTQNPQPRARFVDILPMELQKQNATRRATYAVEATNLNSRGAGLSNQVQVPLAPTLPPPANFRAEVNADGVDLSWNCEAAAAAPGIRYVYRIYRRMTDSGVDVRLADVQCSDRHYEDQTSEWQKSYEYRITAVTEAEIPRSPGCSNADSGKAANCIEVVAVEGTDSPPQKVFTKDVYPPAVPNGLQAVFSGPGQPPFIDLLWAPNTEADLSGYNVYRREEGAQPAKINSEPVKSPAFRDVNVISGKTYWYSVSAVDARGNESARSEESSESVP